MRLSVALAASLALALVLGAPEAAAHAGLTQSDPVAGARLGASPTDIRLTFSERPQASLSEVSVLDTNGASFSVGSVGGGDALSLVAHVRTLPRGIYTVNFRVVSAVDGHATAGAYSFGVRADPGTGAVTATSTPSASRLEMLARWVLLGGLVALLGAAAAGVFRFGGGSELWLGALAWAVAVIGLFLLAIAQRRIAGASLSDFFDASVGRALGWRALALAAAGVALLVARRPRDRRLALGAVGVATMATIAVHVSAGHAAAGASRSTVRIVEQWAHFSAAGIWLGGLLALLLGIRGAPSDTKTAAVRRFSTIAAVALVVLVATGVLRSINELSSPRELYSTGYGKAVLAKIALLLAIAVFGALNRWRSVPQASSNLRPLRQRGKGELALTAGALLAAAVLGSLAPPAASRITAPEGLSVSAADFGTTTRVTLTTASDEPGANRFEAKIADYDSKAAIEDARVSLRVVPLDDPGVATTTLRLRDLGGGAYAAEGANLAFEGRWGVTALVERGGESVEIPLRLLTATPGQAVSIERIPGRPTNYTVTVSLSEVVRFSLRPERPGRSRLHVTVYDVIGDEQQIDTMVLTHSANGGLTRQLAVKRSGRSFVAPVELQSGVNTFTAVARTPDGTRVRAALDVDIPDE